MICNQQLREFSDASRIYCSRLAFHRQRKKTCRWTIDHKGTKATKSKHSQFKADINITCESLKPKAELHSVRRIYMGEF